MILKICDSTDRQRLDYFRWVMDRENVNNEKWKRARYLVGWLANKIRKEDKLNKLK